MALTSFLLFFLVTTLSAVTTALRVVPSTHDEEGKHPAGFKGPLPLDQQPAVDEENTTRPAGPNSNFNGSTGAETAVAVKAELSTCLDEGLRGMMSFYSKWTKSFWGVDWWISGNGFATLGAIALHTEPSNSSSGQLPLSKKEVYTIFKDKFPFFEARCLVYCAGNDDRQWWALTWIHGVDLAIESGDLDTAKKMLHATELIWKSVQATWNSSKFGPSCGGGVLWADNKSYKNAVTNEQFIQLAAELAQRVDVVFPERRMTITTMEATIEEEEEGSNDSSSSLLLVGNRTKAYYTGWAIKAWNWFNQSGMIDPETDLINDGLTTQTCVNNGGPTWTYNQGVVLGALANLYRLTNNTDYLVKGIQLSNASMSILVTSTGILKELKMQDADDRMFKGVYQRNLYRLWAALTEATETEQQQQQQSLGLDPRSKMKQHANDISAFILRNAASICQNDSSAGAKMRFFDGAWQGPFKSKGVSRQIAAVDGIFAAVAMLGHH